ncbi:hypothetical protein PKHYL_27030 [Psychrobacter sp. KH172YL61]|uniref:DUF3164 family protein n=1 Tax=Psychrobacter sp. KH172YL61 TaxID=2517899 RepID=UPI0010B98D44|nr:DUF3164 family protein [Psychrobacter sp. KH172YL61]BBI68512.1 hypothetical protein PKHYL_27030 [Psychrobacter sp. KH172YL61]
MTNQTTSPVTTIDDKDYMTDDKGRLTPVDAIKPIDKLRDETVCQAAQKVIALHQTMKSEKKRCSHWSMTFWSYPQQSTTPNMVAKRQRVPTKF